MKSAPSQPLCCEFSKPHNCPRKLWWPPCYASSKITSVSIPIWPWLLLHALYLLCNPLFSSLLLLFCDYKLNLVLFASFHFQVPNVSADSTRDSLIHTFIASTFTQLWIQPCSSVISDFNWIQPHDSTISDSGHKSYLCVHTFPLLLHCFRRLHTQRR